MECISLYFSTIPSDRLSSLCVRRNSEDAEVLEEHTSGGGGGGKTCNPGDTLRTGDSWKYQERWNVYNNTYD